MKKVTFIMALAAAAGLASCTAQSPKANLKTDVDSLSYAIGMARTEGLDQYLAQQGIDVFQVMYTRSVYIDIFCFFLHILMNEFVQK